MAVTRSVRVDLKKFSSSYQGDSWYSQNTEVKLEGETVVFSNAFKISLRDLRAIVLILEKPIPSQGGWGAKS